MPAVRRSPAELIADAAPRRSRARARPGGRRARRAKRAARSRPRRRSRRLDVVKNLFTERHSTVTRQSLDSHSAFVATGTAPWALAGGTRTVPSERVSRSTSFRRSAGELRSSPAAVTVAVDATQEAIMSSDDAWSVTVKALIGRLEEEGAGDAPDVQRSIARVNSRARCLSQRDGNRGSHGSVPFERQEIRSAETAGDDTTRASCRPCRLE